MQRGLAAQRHEISGGDYDCHVHPNHYLRIVGDECERAAGAAGAWIHRNLHRDLRDLPCFALHSPQEKDALIFFQFFFKNP